MTKSAGHAPQSEYDHTSQAKERAEQIAWSMALEGRELTPEASERLTQHIENQ